MAQPVIFPLSRLTDPHSDGAGPFLNRLQAPSETPTDAHTGTTFQSRAVANYRGSFSAVSNAADQLARGIEFAPLPLRSRSVPFYRGSYSAISGAADQPGPGLEYAPTAKARAVALYDSPNSATLGAFFATTDPYAPVTTEPSRPNYRAPGSQLINSADQAGPGLEYAPTASNPPTSSYAAPGSQTISSFTSALDTWAQTTFGRSIPFYSGSRPITISVWDPATSTFEDWTPAALLSRAVKAYAPPAAQPQVAWGSPIVTDQPAPVSLSRPVAFYRAPSALTISVYDPSTNTFADWVPGHAMGRLGRQVAPYTAPRSVSTNVYSSPAAPSSTDYAAPASSRPVASYRGSFSAAMGAADQAGPGIEWRGVFQRQAARPYLGSPSRVTPVFFAAAPGSSSDYAAAIVSRQVARYRGSYSLSSSAADQPAPVVDSWANVASERPLGVLYAAPRSIFFGSADQAFDDWAASFTSRVLHSAPPSSQRPSIAATPTLFGSEYASLAVRRAKDPYTAPRSLTIVVCDAATNTFADWTPSALLSRRVAPYAAPTAQPQVAWGSSIITDAWAPFAWERAAPLYRAPISLVRNVYDPASNTFSDWAPPALLSRVTSAYRAQASFIARSFDQPAQPSSTDYVASITSRAVALYRAAPSTFWPASQPTAADTWATAILSRGTPAYAPKRGLTIPVWDPATNTFADWAPAPVTSRQLAERFPLSSTIACYQVDVAYAPIINSARAASAERPASLTIAAYSSTVADAFAFIAASQRLRAELGTASATILVVEAATAQALAPVITNPQRAYRTAAQARSAATTPLVTPAAANYQPRVVKSRSVPLWTSPRSRVWLVIRGKRGDIVIYTHPFDTPRSTGLGTRLGPDGKPHADPSSGDTSRRRGSGVLGRRRR